MDKNWLIRTKSNYILGPISKEKVVELYHNGSVKPDDEICSGNGYWFYIREEELVLRFLLGSEIQDFNPVSEAKNIPPLNEETAKKKVEDITLIGGRGLEKESSEIQEITAKEISSPILIPEKKELSPSLGNKKKNNSNTLKSKISVDKKIKKQTWLYYASILGLIILFCLVYFRKSIIRKMIDGEISEMNFNVINNANAQDVVSKKKKIFEKLVTFEGITFRPVIGLNGFNVLTDFNIEQISCSDLNQSINQLGVILHPPEYFNERLLIKIRDCVLQLPESHPLKKWLKWISIAHPLKGDEQKKKDFLIEIINSPFNLMTDVKIKNELVKIILDIPGNSIPEELLKSYLYLIIGNITRSDNILKKIMLTIPSLNWQKTSTSFYHEVAFNQSLQLLKKMGRHPSDRKVFQLLILYFKTYMNSEELLKSIDEIDTSEVEAKLNLEIIKQLSPSLVHYLVLDKLNDRERIKKLRDDQSHLEEQSYWIWPFMNIDPLVSNSIQPQLKRLEKNDELWFIYLMDNEKISDLFSKNFGRSFLPGRRPFLKHCLNDPHTFMMSLYKLIEMGDISNELVLKTITHFMHD